MKKPAQACWRNCAVIKLSDCKKVKILVELYCLNPDCDGILPAVWTGSVFEKPEFEPVTECLYCGEKLNIIPPEKTVKKWIEFSLQCKEFFDKEIRQVFFEESHRGDPTKRRSEKSGKKRKKATVIMFNYSVDPTANRFFKSA